MKSFELAVQKLGYFTWEPDVGSLAIIFFWSIPSYSFRLFAFLEQFKRDRISFRYSNKTALNQVYLSDILLETQG